MIRPILFAASRAAASTVPRQAASIARPLFRSSLLSSRHIIPAISFQGVRCYASSGGLAKEEVTGRILDLLKNFDKVTDPSKLSETSNFNNDLGLDSLDTVEVVMAIEEEFSIEIPDKEADGIHSVDQAVTYILSQPDAH
ncbi:acyl carrier protein [Microthyrium microscopicum]|uniref:Acyl carrier protein n=1 Tax=Microthyrium microscopicum TaxID=703497 RepID=A0A6A6TZP0_9PEZI|nr:acyl carrier protein [Microthyrium microscopicum]